MGILRYNLPRISNLVLWRSYIGKTAEKLEPYMKDARITDAKRVSSVGELTSWLN